MVRRFITILLVGAAILMVGFSAYILTTPSGVVESSGVFVVASGSFSNQIAGRTVLTFTAPANKVYLITCYESITVVLGGSIVCSVSYTEAVTLTPRSLVIVTSAHLVGMADGDQNIWVASGTVITEVVTFTGLTGTYNVAGTLVDLGVANG